jgi:4'-phosphopantetheinyl transferase
MTAMVHLRWSPLFAEAPPADWFDATENERLDRLERVRDRQHFLTSRILLKRLVGHLADTPAALVRLSYECSRCGRQHGRPVVVAPQAASLWHVSLSHARCHVMVAATLAGPLGVDVEQVAATGFKGFDDVALTSAERAVMERFAPAARARARAVYWTRKEAVLKATGRGLAVDPCALEVTAPNLPAALVAWRAADPPRGPVQITDVPVEAYLVAALAVLTPTPCTVVIQPS